MITFSKIESIGGYPLIESWYEGLKINTAEEDVKLLETPAGYHQPHQSASHPALPERVS